MTPYRDRLNAGEYTKPEAKEPTAAAKSESSSTQSAAKKPSK
jgi:hypothetical protein